MTAPGMTVFLAGFVAGGVVFWNLSLAIERFRRARREFTATKNGLRTLVEMMLRRGVDAARGMFVAAAIMAALFVWWRHRGFQ